MDWPQYIITLIIALGGGATIRELIAAVGRARSGKMHTTRVEAKSLVARTRYAEDLAQYERDFRIIVQDHAAHCRRLALEYGAPAEVVGLWPPAPDPPPRPVDEPETSTI